MSIILIFLCALILCILKIKCSLRKPSYKYYPRIIVGGDNRYSISPDLRLKLISNDINDILTIKDSSRPWIKNYFFGLINKISLHHQEMINRSTNYFPYEIPPDKKLIKNTLNNIKYTSILKERSPNSDIDERINKIADAINKYKKISYTIERQNDRTIVKTKTTSIPIENKLISKYKQLAVSKEEVIGMLIRYTADNPYKEGELLSVSGSLLSVDPLIYRQISKMFNDKSVECFASPINNTLNYCSIFNRDCIFSGCIGQLTIDVIKKRENTVFIANPPFDNMSVKYVVKLAKSMVNSTMIIILPAKDIKVFSYTWGRKGHGNDFDFDTIKELIKMEGFKGMLSIPALFMYYVSLDNNKVNITFDTLFIIISNDKTKDDDFFTKLKHMIYDSISENRIETKMKKFNVGKLDRSKLIKHFDDKITDKLLEDIDIGREKMLKVLN
uniref:PCIF1 WW domain-containing protein n=1 Tax=viral metagenome TaxID=1070528 RepID=A0A6C0LJY5_9ZZZZ